MQHVKMDQNSREEIMNDNRRQNREPKKLYEDKIISIGKVTKTKRRNDRSGTCS